MAGDVEEVTVRLTGGGPWGFRLRGGAGSPWPLVVSKVRKKSKSYPALEEGDQLVRVNGAPCSHMSYDQAMNLVDQGGLTLELELLRKKKVPKFAPSTSPQTWEQAVSSEILSKNATDRGAYHLKSFQQQTTSSRPQDEMDGISQLQQSRQQEQMSVTSQLQTKTSTRQHEQMEVASAISQQQTKTSSRQQDHTSMTSELQTKISTREQDQMDVSSVTSQQQMETSSTQQSLHQESKSESPAHAALNVAKLQEEQTSGRASPSARPFSPALPREEPKLRHFTPGVSNTLPRPFTPTFSDTATIAESIKAQRHEKFFQSMGPRPFTPTFSESEFQERLERELSPTPQATAAKFSDFSLKNKSVLYSKGPRPFTPTFSPSSGRAYYEDKTIIQQTKGPRPFTPTLSDSMKGADRRPMSAEPSQDFLPFPNAADLREANKENASPFSTTKSQIDEMIREIEADFFDKREEKLQKAETKVETETSRTTTQEASSQDSTGYAVVTTDPKIYEPPPGMDDEDEACPLRIKKKMFSSSSFYEEPNAIFPTVEEQVELCRKIADSLSSVSNQRSKGANMFFKRVKRSQRWVHEAPSGIGSRYSEASTTEESEAEDLPYVKVSKGPPKLKLILDPRQIQDLSTLRQAGVAFVEHTTQSPEVCRDIVRDLNSPMGRGAKMFAKRKLKSEEWVVDESRIREHLRKAKSATPQPAAKPAAMGGSHTLPRTQKIKMVKTPWEAALESPYGSCDSAFVSLHPIEVAETVIRAAESKLTSSCFSGTTTEVSTPLGSTPEPGLVRSGPTFNNTARAWGAPNPRQAFRPVVYPCT